MTESFYYYRRIAGYLSGYVSVAGFRKVPPEKECIRTAISVMMRDMDMSAEEIRRGALEECSVFIADEFFEEVDEDD